MKKETAQSRWESLQVERSPYLDAAIQSSELTIPTMIPESDLSTMHGMGRQSLPSLYQGAGARGVSSLAAKLLLTLYPPQQPFFRLRLDGERLDNYLEERGADSPEIRSEIEEKLSSFERTILAKLDSLSARAALFEAVKHLIVSGNGLLYVGEEYIQFYSLRSFVCRRDPEGNVTEAVIKEVIAEEYLPDGVKKTGSGNDYEDTMCDIYTHIAIQPNQNGDMTVVWRQEYEGETIPGSAGFSRLEESPWIFLRLNRIAGESYGRGLVEEVIGDLQTLESLSKAIVEGNLINAKTIFLVSPNGVTRADSLAKTENGGFATGDINDVAALETNKARDFSVALQSMQMIERRLQFTFMTTESVQRQAERVTAEEIRLMAEQLEQTLGGVYSILSDELQLPLIRRVIAMMERAGEIQRMPKQFVRPHITAGIDAIGRGNDRARLGQFLSTVAQALGPEMFMQYINPSELIRRFAAADGIEAKGLVKTEQELQAEKAQADKLQLEQSIVQNALRNGPAGTANAAPGSPGQAQQASVPPAATAAAGR